MTATIPQTTFDGLRAEVDALVRERDAMFNEWTLALGARSAAIHRGDARAAEQASKSAEAKRDELIEVCDKITSSVGPLRQLIESHFIETRRELEKDVAPVRQRLNELEHEHKRLEIRERELVAAISSDVARVDGQKLRRSDWLAQLERANLATVQRLFPS